MEDDGLDESMLDWWSKYFASIETLTEVPGFFLLMIYYFVTPRCHFWHLIQSSIFLGAKGSRGGAVGFRRQRRRRPGRWWRYKEYIYIFFERVKFCKTVVMRK